jgi:hypothetical protein
LRETVTKLLPASLPSITPKESNASLGTRCKAREENKITPSSEFFRGQHAEWARDFAITASSTRHAQLLKMVGVAFFQSGKEVARRNAELQHGEAKPIPVATLAEHLAEFDEMWAGMERKWLGKLTLVERRKLDVLTTNNKRDAFRILRNWSQTDSFDFKAQCRSLGNRLGVTLKTASNIRHRFCALGILHQTAHYVPHKLAARYKWTANTDPKRK